MPAPLTYKTAMAAGRDAANRRMRKAGRTEWNEEDYREAAAVTNRLLGTSKVLSVTLTEEPEPRAPR